MRRIGAALALALAACSASDPVPGAVAAADGFHTQFNARQFGAIYAGADRLLKTGNPEKDFVAMLGGIRAQLGAFRSADAPGWNEQRNANGDFVTLLYHARYERGAADETFVYRVGGGRPTLVRYTVTGEARR